jgi:hypothetical protein
VQEQARKWLPPSVCEWANSSEEESELLLVHSLVREQANLLSAEQPVLSWWVPHSEHSPVRLSAQILEPLLQDSLAALSDWVE